MWVHSATAGVERVLTPAALERGIAITNARGVFSDPIAEYVLMMILVDQPPAAAASRAPARTYVAAARGPRDGRHHGRRRRPRVDRPARRGACPDFRLRSVIATRRQPGTADGLTGNIEILPSEQLPDLMSRSDFMVLALPLTSGTEGMFDAGLLSNAKAGSWLINVARGALIDDRALLRAVNEGPLGGAVLDAFRDEPLPAESPLYSSPHIIVTPHTSWSSRGVLDGASSFSATTSAVSARASRCSTSSIRALVTEAN